MIQLQRIRCGKGFEKRSLKNVGNTPRWSKAPSTYTNQLLISGHQMHYLYRFKGMYLVTSHLLSNLFLGLVTR